MLKAARFFTIFALLCCSQSIGANAQNLIDDAENGDAEAQFNLFLSYTHGGVYGVEKNKDKALAWLRKSAENGYSSAQNILAGKYLRGEEVERDKNIAFELYRASAANGNSDAKYELGHAYSGHPKFNISPQQTLATKYFRESAESGRIDAQLMLAQRLLDGIGTERNREEAKFWLRKASDKGNMKARVQLSNLGE